MDERPYQRPQDVERKDHKRKGQPGPATVALLERYQTAMRSELSAILDALADVQTGLLDVPPMLRIPLEDARRGALWSRAITLGRELGSAIDVPEAQQATGRTVPRRRARVDYGD